MLKSVKLVESSRISSVPTLPAVYKAFSLCLNSSKVFSISF